MAKKKLKQNKKQAEKKVEKVVEEKTQEEKNIEKITENDRQAIENLDSKLNDFISMTAKSKVAIIIPLFGYWKDVKDNPLNLEVFKTVMDRVVSNSHEMYIIFVAEDKRLINNITQSIGAKSFGGNSFGVSVPTGSSYSDYIDEGVFAALNETDAKFLLFLNPWIMLQYNSIDMMVDRINRGDVMTVSGLNVRGLIEAEKFDNTIYNLPRENRDMDMNFWGMARYSAEMIVIDPLIKTHNYLSRDIWQQFYSKGYEVIVSNRIPFYSFDIDWKLFEKPEDCNTDKQNFMNKWHFEPGI
jgi:hypothetical protein